MHAVVPSAGPETGGTVLTVIGVGLSTDLAPGLSCRIDGTPVEAKLLAGESNAQSASCRVPPGAAGFVGVMFAVYNATGSGNAGGEVFQYQAVAHVSTVLPPLSSGGEPISLEGAHMFSAAQVFIGGVQTQATIVSSRLALAETPEGLGAGRFSVTATNGGLEGGGSNSFEPGAFAADATSSFFVRRIGPAAAIDPGVVLEEGGTVLTLNSEEADVAGPTLRCSLPTGVVKVAARPGAVLGTVECVSPALAPRPNSIIVDINPSGAAGSVASAPRGPLDAWERTSVLVLRGQELAAASPEVSGAASGGKESLLSGLLLVTGSALETNALPRPQCIVGSSAGAAKSDAMPQWKDVAASDAAAELGPLGVLCFSPPPPETGFVPIRVGGYRSSESLRAAGQLLVVEPTILDSWATSPLLPHSASGGELHVVDVVGAGIWGPHPARGTGTSIRFVLSTTPVQSFVGDADADGIGEWEVQSSGEAMDFSVGGACEWVSTALARCEALPAGPGVVGGAVGVVLELRTLHPLTHTGKVSAARTTEVSAPALDVRPTLGSVSPERGDSMGGAPVRLTGAGLGSDVGLRCRFAAVTVSLRPMLSEGSLDAVSAECLPPARPAGTMEVGLQIQGGLLQTLVQNEQWPQPVFLYTALDAPVVTRLEEYDGLAAIIGSGFPHGAQGFCSFKRSTSTLEVLSESRVVCNTPAHLLTAFSHVQLEEPLHVRVPGEPPFFVIQARTPDPLQLFPHSAYRGGGTLFFVEGTDILNYQDLDGPWCHVGALAHTSHKVSSTLAVCEMPALSDHGRRAVLEMSNELHVLSQGGLPFTLHSPAIFSVATRIALESGGTTVDLEGIRLGSELLQCQIGTTKLDGRVLSENGASCVAPAHAPAAVPLLLSRNHRDFALGAGNLTYHDLNEAEFTLPPVGQVFGGQSVYLYLEGPILHERLPMCLFGDSLEKQSVSTGVLSPHGGEILHCLSPPLTAGFAALELAFDFFQFTVTGSQFMFQSPPAVDQVQPVSILAEGGTVVRVRGLNFIGLNECNFNEEVFGRVVAISSALIICEAPAAGTGEVSLEIRTEGSAILLNQKMVSVAGVLLEGLSGTQGSVKGGVFVSVYGNFLENQQATCKFGAVGPISSRQVGADYISCLSPAHAPTTVPVEVSINRYEYSLDGLAFQYLESFDILVSDVVHPMTSGALIFVTSTENIGFNSLSCSLDEIHVHTEISGTGVRCMAPSVASGFVSLTLTHETISVAEGGSIQFVVPARILDLFPDVVTTGGGTVVSVPGQNLVDLDGVFFNFGGTLVSMHPISSALGLCEVPAQNEGSVPVSVQQSSSVASSPSDASIGYVYGAETYGVSPPSGLASGGAVVGHSVNPGSGFEPLHGTMGTLTYVSCRWLSLEALECVAPAHAPGIIPASVMLDGNRQVGGVAFRFVREGELSVVTPDNAPASGGEMVSVVGSDLDSVYGCMFGSAMGTLDIVDSQHIICGVPSLSGGFHELTVLQSRIETLPGSLDFQITSHSFVAAALPNAGPYFGGSPVAVFGNDFLEGGHECIFGDMSSPPSHYVSSSLVICISPPYTGSHFFSKAAVDFALGPAGASREQYGGTFSYFQQPDVTAFQPVSGLSFGGATITLAGSNFTDSPDLSCKFGTISGASAVFYDDSEIVCRAPAHAPSTYNSSTGVCANPVSGSCHVVPLEVTMNHRDYTFFNHTFNYLPTETDSGSGGGGGGGGGGGTGSSGTQIEGISIRGVPVTGGTILYIIGQNIQPLGIGCKFSTTQTPATVLSTAEVLCPTPPLEAGFAAFELILFGDLLTQTNLQVLFYTRPKVEQALPGIISDAGSSLVSVYGEDFADGNTFPQGTQTTKTYCMLGTLTPSEAHFVSSSMILCEALGLYPTFLGVRVSSNGIDWSNDEVYVELEDMPELSALSPFIGQELGGEAVMLYVSGVSERREVVVSVGTIKGIHIRSVDEHAVHIMMPSHAPRTVPVLLGSNFNDVGIYGLTYQYMETPALDFFIPEKSAVQGGVQVHVQGSHFSQGLSHTCLFSETASPSTVTSHTTLFCMTPEMSPGFHSFRISQAGPGPLQLEAVILPEAWDLDNEKVTSLGGSVLAVSGMFFRPGNICYFGASARRTLFVSSALVKCETPESVYSNLHLEVTPGFQVQAAATSLNLQMAETTYIASVYPHEALHAGGQRITVNQVLSSGDSQGLQVGTVGPLATQRVSEFSVECVSPAHAPGVVPVSMTPNSRDFAVSMVNLVYTYEVKIDAVYPEVGPLTGGVSVIVTGSGFAADTITCRFGLQTVQGVARSSEEVRCITPAHPPGTVHVEVSLEGWGTSGQEAKGLGAYTFQVLPSVRTVQPASSPALGGGVIHVLGDDFSSDSLCWIGHGASSAYHISSALVACEVDAQREGLVQVEIATRYIPSGLRAGQAALLETYTAMAVTAVSPSGGVFMGGDAVEIYGGPMPGYLADLSLGCSMGTIGPMSAKWVSDSSVECVSPAHVPRSVPVAVTANGRDASASEVHFVYTVGVEVDAVYPEVGPVTGGTSVLVVGSGFTSKQTACRFGFIDVPGVTVSPNEVRCLSPEHPAGTVHVEVSLEGWSANANDMRGLGAYTFQVLPSVRTVQPASSPALGGGVIHVLGDDFSSDSLCWIGHGASSAYHISSALVACEVDAQREGLVQVEIATRYIPSGLRAGQAALLETYTAMAVTAVSPSGGVFMGGDAVEIYGGPMPGYLADLSLGCSMGTIGPMSAKWVSDSSVECVSPAHVPRSVPVAVTANGRDASASEVHFVYTVGVEVDAVYPEVGPVTGGTSVLVVGSGFTAESTACRFGVEVTEGTVLDPGSFLCDVPAVATGHVPISVETSHGRTLNMAGAVDFAVESHASIHVVFPSPTVVEYSSPSSLQGENFGRISLCFVGEDRAERHLVSSALMKCVFPNVPSDAVVVSVGLQHGPLSDSVSVPLLKSTAALAIAPATGPAKGGSEVLASGYGFVQDEALSCKFGTIGPVAGRYSSYENMHCVTPGHISGVVPFTISPNRGQFFSEGLVFEFQENLAVTGVVPRSGLDMGNTPVFVMGTNFVNSISLSCVFGKEIVQATFLTSTSLMCVSPPQPVSNVFLEVSNNGEDFTSDRFIFGYDICPPGSYCPDGEILSCPRGTYCPGTGNHNFTACPPGLYQPYTGQENCIPSPVGFIAPDFGMEIVRPCPRGAVCDITGLVSWEKQCPPGHFCLEGTRTANFTDFTVSERPLPCPFGYYCGPGVVSDQTIANNFSTPQPCHPGYLCEPGSVTPQGSGPCPPGHYCPPGEMLPCPPRTFCSDVANTEPRPCQPGSYNQEYGQAKCKESPVGTISPGFARLLPERCPPGFVCDEPGLSLPMKRCPRGHFCQGNAVTTDPLAGLDEQKIKRLSPIDLDPDLFRPKPCLPSTFCMEGVLSNVTKQGDFNFPQLCKEGSYCEWGTSDKTSESQGTDISNAMLPCPPGHYCPEGTYIPIPSPRGSFARGTGNSQPALCLPGSYTHYEGFEVCLACPAGFEAQRDGTFKPSICGPGTFRSLRDSITCKNCPMGTWSPFTGLTEESLCVPCNPGIVCGVEGMQNNKPFGDNVAQVTNDNIKLCESGDPDCYLVELQQLGKATLCPEGYVCDARTSVATQKCPDGFFCGYGTTPESQFMNPCPPGYYCPEGSAASSRFQFPCLRCHFCELGTGVILPRCPEGTESEALSNNIDQCTADGITFWQIQPLRNELIDLTVAKSQNVTDEEALEGEDTETSSARKLQQSGGGFGSLLGLGDEVGLDAESNSTSQDSTVDPFEHLAGCKAEGFEILNPQLVYTVNETGDNSVALDAEGRPLIKYTLPRYYTARLTFDFRNISTDISYGDHFEVSIFSGDRKVDKTLCEVGTPEHKRVPCAPWDEGDLINWNTMGEIQSRLYEDKCPPSTESTELPFWFVQRKERLSDGDKVDKHNIMELSVLALEDITFRVEVRMLHGLYQLQTRSGFLDTLCIDAIGPERASTYPDQQFAVVMRRNDDLMLPLNVPQFETVHRSIQLGYSTCSDDNLHPSCRLNAHNMLISYNSSRSSEGSLLMHAQGSPEIVGQLSENAARRALLQRQYQRSYRNMRSSSRATRRLMSMVEEGSSGISRRLMASDDTGGTSGPVDISTLTEAELEALLVPDVIEMQEDMLQDASIYWKSERSILAMTYLPYLSACRGFDSYVHFSQLIETPFMDSESGNYGKCTFVDPEDTIFVSQWAPQAPPPDSDECDLSFTCFYEENIQEAAAVTRWYELEGDTVFYLSTDPEDMDQVYEASIMATDDSEPPLDTSRYDNLITTQEMIAVSMGPADDGIQVQKNTVPKKLDFTVEYFQRSKFDKRIITAAIGFDEYLPAKKHDGEYTLSFTLTALNFFNLLNAFAFNNLFYFMLFVGIGGFAVAITVIFWLFNRIFTRLRYPPKFRFLPYLRIITTPPVVGTCLAMIPFLIGQRTIRAMIVSMAFFDALPTDLDNLGKTITDDELTKGQNGRMAVCFMIVSLFMLWSCSRIMIPKRNAVLELGEDEEEEVFSQEEWKRSHFIIANLAINAVNVALIEFSFTAMYGQMFFVCFLLMKVLHIIIEMMQESFLKEALLCTPASVCLSMTAGLVTIAADDFTDFTLGFFLELFIGLGESVFLDSGIALVSAQWPKLTNAVSQMVMKRRGLREIVQLEAEEEESSLEDLMGFLTGYGVGASSLILTPFFLYFYFDFNPQLQLSFLFGIRQKDLLIYLLFAGVIVIFQFIMDVVLFNTQELFHGWKVYEYMKYARYRFNNRSARWKGMELHFDESISAELRTVDQMCFSSQFYFLLGLGGAGSFLFVLSIEMMLRVNYNMFKDPCFLLLIGIVTGGCILVQNVSLFVADVTGVWKVKGTRGFGDNIVPETGDLPFDINVFREGTDRESSRREGLGGEFSLDDITSDSFRHKFLEHNRTWVLDQLSNMLTPRTAKRLQRTIRSGGKFRGGGGLSDDDSDEGEPVEFGQIELSFSSTHIIRSWLTQARQRAPGRFKRYLSQLSESGSSESEAERPKFPPVRVSPFARSLASGWLQTARQNLRSGGQRRMLSDSSDESATSGSSSDDEGRRTRFGDIRVSYKSRSILNTWLLRARTTMGSSTKHQELLSSSGSSESDDSDLDGARWGKATIEPASSGILRKWLEAARARGPRPGARGGRLQTSRSSYISSDSESSDDDFLPKSEQRLPLPALKPNSLRALRWWLQKVREQ